MSWRAVRAVSVVASFVSMLGCSALPTARASNARLVLISAVEHEVSQLAAIEARAASSLLSARQIVEGWAVVRSVAEPGDISSGAQGGVDRLELASANLASGIESHGQALAELSASARDDRGVGSISRTWRRLVQLRAGVARCSAAERRLATELRAIRSEGSVQLVIEQARELAGVDAPRSGG